jgi:hypothetical protein
MQLQWQVITQRKNIFYSFLSCWIGYEGSNGQRGTNQTEPQKWVGNDLLAKDKQNGSTCDNPVASENIESAGGGCQKISNPFQRGDSLPQRPKNNQQRYSEGAGQQQYSAHSRHSPHPIAPAYSILQNSVKHAPWLLLHRLFQLDHPKCDEPAA